jgi:hypothetical protein
MISSPAIIIQLNLPEKKTGYFCGIGGAIVKYTKGLNTGLNDNFVRQNGFRFYPNPAKGNITIEMKNYKGKSEIQIIDIHGKICLKNHDVSTEKTILGISHLPTGVYLLKVMNENKTETVKFIKE